MDETETSRWFKEDLAYFEKTGAKIVRKPWGAEIWLEFNDRYCYKRIYITQGNQTSLQYHEQKLETNYIIKGWAEVWMQNPIGKNILRIKDIDYQFIITKKGKNTFFTITPPTIHRIKALTNIVLQEVSTPHVDDVIRIEDDTGRGDGRIESEHQS